MAGIAALVTPSSLLALDFTLGLDFCWQSSLRDPSHTMIQAQELDACNPPLFKHRHIRDSCGRGCKTIGAVTFVFIHPADLEALHRVTSEKKLRARTFFKWLVFVRSVK
jgi:hypothetical protein